MAELQLTFMELVAFLDEAFPPETRASRGELVSVSPNVLRMMLNPLPSMRRPGGIVSGPSMMSLADLAAYAVIAVHRGAEPKAVTHSLSITFMRSAMFEPIFADARLLKLGSLLATVDVRLWQGNEDRLIAQSTVGYALL